MHDPRDVGMRRGQRLDGCAIRHIRRDERESGAFPQPVQPRLFQRHVVIGIQIVDPDDTVAAREQLAEADRATFDAVAKARGVLRGPYSILMYSPKFCVLVSEVSRYLRRLSLVKPEAGELCIIAVAREKDCPYVWASHVVAARKAGVSEQAIVAVRDRLELSSLDQSEADIIDYVRQLHRSQRVAQPLFDRLCERHGIPWLVELTAMIGHYGMVTAQLNAFEVAPRADAEQLPL
jgi:4-carboxymuconolactone decarboxylase